MVRKVMTESDLVVACKNIGFDLTCGACAGQFYTGAQLGEHTCPSGGRTETQRADGAEAALAIMTERLVRAEDQCKQLLAAIQTATVGDCLDADRVSKYCACLLCKRDLNVCERDYRVCLETDALNQACKGAKVRALIPLDVSLSSIAQARLDEGLASARRGDISPWKQSEFKLPPGACRDCGGEGQVQGTCAPSTENPEGVYAEGCGTCGGTGLAPSPIRDMVLEFHATFLPEQTRPTVGVPNDDLVRLRVKLIFEEAFEFLDSSFEFDGDLEGQLGNLRKLVQSKLEAVIALAPIKVNIVEVADAFADLAYVVEGGNLAYGIDSRAVLAEVHASNMSKVGGHRSESGKWIKPPTYCPADVASVLKKQGWQP
jgi:predicted HAD superfamily Cof-like phosphohydrolase